ncbi:MAG TPA: isoprenylcysteine carboxylmethyltransferase family protein [Clostridia bacterium]
MVLINIVSFLLLCIWGISYITKQIILSKKNKIKANVLGKGAKPKQALFVEKCLKGITFIGVGNWLVDAVSPSFSKSWFILHENIILSFLGLVITFIGIIFFILAMVFMKTSWRAGIDKSAKTALVADGLYKFSRNPAFVGMDLMFIGNAVTHSNLITIIITLLIAVWLNLQILQEETHMKETFNKEYHEYKAKTPRYLFF